MNRVSIRSSTPRDGPDGNQAIPWAVAGVQWMLEVALAFFLFTGVLLAAEAPKTRPTAGGIEAIAAVGITVSDMDRSVAFYTKVLCFEKTSEVEVSGPEYEHLEGVFGLRMRVVRMKLGDESLELMEYLVPRGRPLPEDSRSNDRWFQHVAIIVSDMDRAYQWLRSNKVEHASTGPQRLPDWNKNAGGIQAFYFKDPDGHSLEILHFPEGKGRAKWHVATGNLFLGIDHTAIVVADTDESLGFYRGLLGMQVVGESENYGVEQEHLNNVFGARLRITALRVAEGPGIEFLEYLTPHDGRPVPSDARANDIGFWQTQMVVSDAESVSSRLFDAKATFVSPGVVEGFAKTLGFRKGLLVRDRDGHALEIVQH